MPKTYKRQKCPDCGDTEVRYRYIGGSGRHQTKHLIKYDSYDTRHVCQWTHGFKEYDKVRVRHDAREGERGAAGPEAGDEGVVYVAAADYVRVEFERIGRAWNFRVSGDDTLTSTPSVELLEYTNGKSPRPTPREPNTFVVGDKVRVRLDAVPGPSGEGGPIAGNEGVVDSLGPGTTLVQFTSLGFVWYFYDDGTDDLTNIPHTSLLELVAAVEDTSRPTSDVNEFGALDEALHKFVQSGRDAAMEAAREAAILQVNNMLPVEHFIKFKMPDGEERKVGGRPHKQVEQLTQVCALRIPAFCIGPAGSGKTTAARQVAQVLGLTYTAASMGPATSQWDLLGFRSPDGTYIPGIMRRPYEFGGVLTLDEMDNTNPSVLTALNAAISDTSCSFPDMDVVKHDDFVLVACGNTYGRGADRMYVGRNQLDAATLDRYANISWEYDEDAEADWAGRDQEPWVKYIQALRHAASAHAMRVIISPRASIFGAKLLRNGVKAKDVREMVVWKGMASDDRTRLESLVKPGSYL